MKKNKDGFGFLAVLLIAGSAIVIPLKSIGSHTIEPIETVILEIILIVGSIIVISRWENS